MFTCTIRYLDTPKTTAVEVETPGLIATWGDRRGTGDEPISGYTANLELTADSEVRYRGTDGNMYFAEPGAYLAEGAALVRDRARLTVAADQACRDDAEIAEAVARYAEIIRQLETDHAQQVARWARDVEAIGKSRTITLTGRSPVTIREDRWLVIADAHGDSDRSPGRTRPDYEIDTWSIRVRQHADGRAIVYAVLRGSPAWTGTESRSGGELLAAGDDIPAAIARVGSDVGLPEETVRDCVADLPAEDLDAGECGHESVTTG